MKKYTWMTLLLSSIALGQNSDLEEKPKELPPFAGKILSVIYESGTLSLELEYSGGCKEHRFEVDWDYNHCETVNYLDLFDFYSCGVELKHAEGSDDMCDGLITQIHEIPLGISDAPEELRKNPVNEMKESYYLHFDTQDAYPRHFWVY